MVFHHPFPVRADGTSGSQVRPYQMLSAFEALGYEVEVVIGHGLERRQAVERIRRDLKKGRRFAFAYSESHTIPTLLTEPHHVPTFPFLDFKFLAFLKRRNVPVGLFYRDVHWRFDQYRAAPLLQRLVSVPLYHYDWHQYLKTVDHLFLPSLAMAAHLPTDWPRHRLSALPPGIPPSFAATAPATEVQVGKELNLFYVGGVKPPLYDLSPTFDYLRDLEHASLTLCCRQQEWQQVAEHYSVPPNVTVVHASGRGLEPYYQQADLFAVLWQPHPYLAFAMPVKVFEALGQALPVVTTPNTETARFVEKEATGWVVASRDAFSQLLSTLQKQPEHLRRKRQDLLAAQAEHTWQARAQQVVDTLTADTPVRVKKT